MFVGPRDEGSRRAWAVVPRLEVASRQLSLFGSPLPYRWWNVQPQLIKQDSLDDPNRLLSRPYRDRAISLSRQEVEAIDRSTLTLIWDPLCWSVARELVGDTNKIIYLGHGLKQPWQGLDSQSTKELAKLEQELISRSSLVISADKNSGYYYLAPGCLIDAREVELRTRSRGGIPIEVAIWSNPGRDTSVDSLVSNLVSLDLVGRVHLFGNPVLSHLDNKVSLHRLVDDSSLPNILKNTRLAIDLNNIELDRGVLFQSLGIHLMDPRVVELSRGELREEIEDTLNYFPSLSKQALDLAVESDWNRLVEGLGIALAEVAAY